MKGLVHYLLVYSHSEQRLMDLNQFTDPEKASEAYREAEATYRGRTDEFEIVLVGADSIATIERTHGHYFRKTKLENPFGDLVDTFA